MKIELKHDKSVFIPFVITVDTAQEFLELYAAVGSVKPRDVQYGMESIKIGHLFDIDNHLAHEKLYSLLGSYLQEVKKTL